MAKQKGETTEDEIRRYAAMDEQRSIVQDNAQKIVDLAEQLKTIINMDFGNWRDRYAVRQIVAMIVANEFDRNEFALNAKEAILNLM